MASSADRMAAGAGFGALAKADELKKRLWFTVGALIIYRLGTYLPLPGIDPGALADIFSQQSSGILGMFDMFSGGALSRMTIFALNIGCDNPVVLRCFRGKRIALRVTEDPS